MKRPFFFFLISLLWFIPIADNAMGQSGVTGDSAATGLSPLAAESSSAAALYGVAATGESYVSEDTPAIKESARCVNPAFRSNLLANIILMPNIGIEVPIGKRFSVASDFIFSHWRINNRYAIQTIQGNLEGRYWLGDRGRELTGWNVGAYITLGGRYDIQWKGGWQGDRFWSAGLTGGYSMYLSPKLNLDLSLAAGFVFTPEARGYERPQEGHLIWKETRYNVARFSLTKVRVSLVWLLFSTRK